MKEFDITEYSKLKKELKQRDIDEKLGNQHSYESQAKLFKPLIDTTKNLGQKIVDGRQHLADVLGPITNQLMRANDQRELPFFTADYPEIEAVPQSTPKRDTAGIVIDLNRMLSDSDRENLQDMSLPLPSEVIKQGTYDSVLERIKILNRQYGQHTGKRSKKDKREKAIYISRMETLKMYRMSLDEQMKALKYRTGEGLKKKKTVRLKRGRGRPKTKDQVIIYENPHQLVKQLRENLTALDAGNNGVYNTAVSILDELLRIRAISKQDYDDIYKNNFEAI